MARRAAPAAHRSRAARADGPRRARIRRTALLGRKAGRRTGGRHPEGGVVIAVHIALAAVACLALWTLWRGVTRAADPRAALIVSGGFLLRAIAGQALFWISWLNLPIARSLHDGEGYWFFAIDSPGYMTYAKLIAQGHPALVYPSRVFVQILGAFIFGFGFFTSVAILLNCAT